MPCPSATDDADRTIVPVLQPSRPASLEAPEPGERFLGPSGLIWTVKAITACGDRIVLTTPTPDGDSGVIVDLLAIARMIPVPIAASSTGTPPVTPGDDGPRCSSNDTADAAPRTRAIPAGIAESR
jgi:hypothetical protein